MHLNETSLIKKKSQVGLIVKVTLYFSALIWLFCPNHLGDTSLEPIRFNQNAVFLPWKLAPGLQTWMVFVFWFFFMFFFFCRRAALLIKQSCLPTSTSGFSLLQFPVHLSSKSYLPKQEQTKNLPLLWKAGETIPCPPCYTRPCFETCI